MQQINKEQQQTNKQTNSEVKSPTNCIYRNVFDEWGLELGGGFGDGESFMGGQS